MPHTENQESAKTDKKKEKIHLNHQQTKTPGKILFSNNFSSTVKRQKLTELKTQLFSLRKHT